jgi:hypothetical protein
MPPRCWALSAADLATLWEECPRCFYLSAVRAFPRPPEPGAPPPIDARLKSGCEGRRTETLAPGVPAGVFEIAERWLESRPLDVHLPDAVRQCVVRGTLDTLVRLDDGGWAIVEVRSAAWTPEPLAFAARRLVGHAWALEHPAPGVFGVGPVTRLGLLVFEPEKFAGEAGLGSLTGGMRWIEVPRDDAALFGLLAEVLSVLDRPEPPGGAPLCGWCVYRDASRRTGL